MNVSVWDTYVTRDDGKIMHFDILVPSDLLDKDAVFQFGQKYLERKQIYSSTITTNECKFCHIEQATQEIMEQIQKNGYFIIEMENCN